MMKNINRILFYSFALLISFNLISCDGAGDEEYGVTLLYMPQAVNQNGGANNNYTFTLASNVADSVITVGVYRSGLQELKSYSVDLKIDTDSLNSAISKFLGGDEDYSDYENVELLPAQYYTLAEKISVGNEQRDGYVHLTINKTQLLGSWADANKKYILPVRITNPSRYELNDKLSLTMFVLSRK